MLLLFLHYDLTLLRCKTCAIDIGPLKATHLLTYLLTYLLTQIRYLQNVSRNLYVMLTYVTRLSVCPVLELHRHSGLLLLCNWHFMFWCFCFVFSRLDSWTLTFWCKQHLEVKHHWCTWCQVTLRNCRLITLNDTRIHRHTHQHTHTHRQWCPLVSPHNTK